MKIPSARTFLACALALAAGCGDPPETVTAPAWQTGDVEGISGASGLALWNEDLLIVCGDDVRDVHAVSREALEAGGPARARTLRIERDDKAILGGAEPFALKAYKLEQLWAQRLDFQALATRPPGFLYLGDRAWRVAWWGQLTAGGDGGATHLRLRGAFVVPGGRRTGSSEGEWRDRGPGLSGFVADPDARTEALHAVDRGVADGLLRIRRVSRFGTPLGVVEVRGLAEDATVEALAWDGGAYLLWSAGTFLRVALPKSGRTAKAEPADLPPLPAGHRWVGLCTGANRLYAVAEGEPATVAWIRR